MRFRTSARVALGAYIKLRGDQVVRCAVAHLLGFVRRSAQFNWLIRRHVNLLVSYARNESNLLSAVATQSCAADHGRVNSEHHDTPDSANMFLPHARAWLRVKRL